MRPALLVALALAVTATGCGGTNDLGQRAAAERAATHRPRAVVKDCSTRSFGDFRGAFADRRNVVEGPLVLVGAGYTPPGVVRRYGGNKFPLLVAAGHRVTIELSRDTHRVAALGYGPLPQGEIEHEDGHRAVSFRACRRGRPTFWSGFVLAREPACIPLHVRVDDEPAPRRVVLRMGERRCD